MRIRFGLITLVVAAVFAMMTGGTVFGRNGDIRAIDNPYYRELEREFVKEVRDTLQDYGYSDSGVMMTRVTDATGRREYTVSIHNSRLDYADLNIRKDILKKIRSLEFDHTKSSFCYVL